MSVCLFEHPGAFIILNENVEVIALFSRENTTSHNVFIQICHQMSLMLYLAQFKTYNFPLAYNLIKQHMCCSKFGNKKL